MNKFLSFTETCNVFGFSKSWLYKKTSDKKLPHYKRGRLYFNFDEIVIWLGQGKVETLEEQVQAILSARLVTKNRNL